MVSSQISPLCIAFYYKFIRYVVSVSPNTKSSNGRLFPVSANPNFVWRQIDAILSFSIYAQMYSSPFPLCRIRSIPLCSMRLAIPFLRSVDFTLRSPRYQWRTSVELRIKFTLPINSSPQNARIVNHFFVKESGGAKYFSKCSARAPFSP